MSDSSAPAVGVVNHVRAGYFDEPDEWVGISHVLEHMFFKGSENVKPGELAHATQELGGFLNAATIYDKTVYYTVVPALDGTWETALRLQADSLMRATLDAEELQRELEVIIQEAKRKLDAPSAVAVETLFENLFARHRIRRWRIGTEERLRSLTADDLRAYYATRYTPGRTIVGVVGCVDASRALDLLEATYGEWSANDAVIAEGPMEDAPPPPSLRVLQGDIQRPLMALGWRTVPESHPDVFALDIASTVLGAGRGSWLNRGVRLPGIANRASSSHYTPSEVGVFTLSIEGAPERIDEAVNRSLALVASLGHQGPEEGDLDRVKSLIDQQWRRRIETMDGAATLLCDFEALGGHHMAAQWYENTMAVSRPEVQEAARTYLPPDAVTGVAYAAPNHALPFRVGAWPPKVTDRGLPSVRVPPLPAPEAMPGEKPAHTFAGDVHHVALPGADLVVRSKPGTGLVYVGACAVGLRDDETTDNAGISSLLTRVAVRGAGGLSAEQLALAGERLGGTVMASSMVGAVGWGITVRADRLAEAAQLIHMIAAASEIDADVVVVERGLQVSDARRSRDDMFGYPVRRVLSTALPGSAYGLPLLGEPESVAQLSPETVNAWAHKLRTRRLVVVAVGDLAPDQLVEQLAPFTEWPPSGTTTAQTDVPKWHAAHGRMRRDKAQSALAMGFPAKPYPSPERYATIVLGAVLSGMAGRLFHALRERRSLAYTVAAMPWLRGEVGALLTYIATSPEREAEARDAMLHELAKVADEPVSDAELTRARNYTAGSFQLRLQSSHAVAAELVEGWLLGDVENLVRAPENLNAVTAEQVQRAAAEIFQTGNRAEFVVEGVGGGR